MTYEAFKIFVFNRIKELLPEHTTVQIQQIPKNNGLVMDGLTITTDGLNISPTIFLNFYYDKRSYFPDMESLCQDILRTYEHNRPSENIDVQFFLDYEQVRKRLAYRIVNYEKNKELLLAVPHVRYLDFAIVFYCLLSISDSNNATILIHNHHLELWSISTEALYQQACENTPILMPYHFQNMSSLINELLPGQMTKEASSHFCPMYILTNRAKLYGASCILYPDLLEQISKQLCSDLILLPSSVHECIVLASKEFRLTHGLNAMVADINQTELAKDEVLSNNVYYFSRKKAKLSICS